VGRGKGEETVTEAAKKPSIFGFLRDAFVEEVPDNKPAPAPAPQATKGSTPAPAAHPQASNGTGPDPQALAKLEAKLQAALPPIYSAFMEQYTQLADVIPDEGMRFKAALKTSHASVDQLSAALDQLLAVMDTTFTDFHHSFEENKAKVVNAAEQGIKATEDLIASREAQLKTIQEELVSLHSKVAADTQKRDSEAAHYDSVRQGFEAAHAQVVSRLNAQKTRIASQPKG
jgi:hypothetical protein